MGTINKNVFISSAIETLKNIKDVKSTHEIDKDKEVVFFKEKYNLSDNEIDLSLNDHAIYKFILQNNEYFKRLYNTQEFFIISKKNIKKTSKHLHFLIDGIKQSLDVDFICGKEITLIYK